MKHFICFYFCVDGFGFYSFFYHRIIVFVDLSPYAHCKCVTIYIAYFKLMPGNIGKIEFLEAVNIVGFHSVKQKIIQIFRTIYKNIVYEATAFVFIAALFTVNRCLYRPTQHYVGKIAASQLVSIL